jgi:DNA-binding PadR family transcriptional regulator
VWWFWRGAVELHVLHHAAERELHRGVDGRRAGPPRICDQPGTLYPTLHRLRDQGLLTCRDEVVEARRRLYRITDAGRVALAEARRALRELAAEVLDG